jgi:hypothetical protein
MTPRHDNFPEPLSVPPQPVALGSNAETRRNKDRKQSLARLIGTQGPVTQGRGREMGYRQWPNAISILEQLRRNLAPIADRC